MLPEQHDILFSFIAILFAVFGVFVFGNVVQACREREELNSKLWGGIFGAYAIVCFLMTVHMFDLVQADQLNFFFSTYLWVVVTLLLAWGVFFKSNKLESQSPPIIRGFFSGLQFHFCLQVTQTGCLNREVILHQRKRL